MQAVVSAVCAAVGYSLGTLAGYLGHVLLHRFGREPDRVAKGHAWTGLVIIVVLAALAAIVAWPNWQNDQRKLVNLGSISRLTVFPMLLATIVVLAVLVLIGRFVWWLVRRADAFFGRHVPVAAAHAITVVLAAGGFFLVFNKVAVDAFFDWANDSFAATDTETPPGVVQPTSASFSGSPASLVPWGTLGYEGRRFAGSAPTVGQLTAFAGAGADVKEPVRVYTGLRSAPSPEARAALAVQELERTGAAEREVLAVVTVTGTGWVDPDAAISLEYAHRGDTAIVAQQYSYLPSWISFLVDADKAAATGEALNDAVHQWWSALPEASRPKLVVFGLSLGSFGAEAAFAGPTAAGSVANLVDRSDGALIVGPTDSNRIWTQLQAAREPGSPVWRPVYDGGRTVQFANKPENLAEPDPAWQTPRVLYIHHPSDPVGYFDYATLWQRPDWTRAPTGYDVPDRVGWWPIVTWVQLVADLIAGFSTPPGHGHNYASDYVAGWTAVVPPAGWTDADSVRLLQHLDLG